MSSDKYPGNSNEAYNSYGETSTNIPVAGDEFKKNESPPDYWGSKKKLFNFLPGSCHTWHVFRKGSLKIYLDTVNPDTQYIPTGDTHVEGVGFDEVNRKPFLLKVIGTVV